LNRIRRGGTREVSTDQAHKLIEARLQQPVERGPVAAHQILARVRNRDRVPVAASKLLEAIRERSWTAPTGDLHERLRRGVTR
jgi:hypothetical protein